MASRATYQNICPEVTGKPWSIMSPNAESPGVLCRPMPKAEGDITLQGFPVTEGQIFWYCRPRRHVIYVI